MSEISSVPMLYHTHHSLDANADDLSFWLAWAHQQGGPILELGCGTGRVLLPLAETGYTIFGLDCDRGMLDFLRERVPVSLCDRVVLMRGDLRSYRLAGRFPLILMPCNTYSTLTLTGRRIALNRARLHLTPEGVFIISMPNPNLLAELSEDGEFETESSFSHPKTGNPVQVSSQWEYVGEGMQFHWHYDHLLPNGRVERETITAFHHSQAPDEILDDFEEAGLEVLHIYGDFDRSLYEPESPNLIIVAKG
ncbi:MAG: class I SAM-dependent methyltransferase [Anaerolineales bacterium]|nr:class I SAM-dependent methyltransferase [Anaerolineales bacterium]